MSPAGLALALLLTHAPVNKSPKMQTTVTDAMKADVKSHDYWLLRATIGAREGETDHGIEITYKGETIRFTVEEFWRMVRHARQAADCYKSGDCWDGLP